MTFQPIDRFPRWEWAMWWDLTIARWHAEGLPEVLTDVFDIASYFGLDPYKQFWFSTTDPTIEAVQHHVQGMVRNMDDYLRIRPSLYPDHQAAIEAMQPWAARQAAGNAVVWKPSEVSARSGALVASLFEGLLPNDVLCLVQGGGDVGAALVDAEVDVVVFTGSVATGRRIAVKCAEKLIPCSLELGGKDAAIVLEDCNLERTARGLVWGAFTNAGQNCASIERVYVHKAIAAQLTERVVALTKELRPGVDTAMLTTERQCAIVRKHLDEALKSGAELLTGGAPEAGSLAFPPTVVKVASDDLALMRDETFGPILPIAIVESEDEAIERTNASRYGLTTSVWTKRIHHAHELAARLRTGVVTINNHGFTAALPAAPWTGVGESGYGVTNSPHALGELVRPRFVLEDRAGAKSELWWYPYTPVLRTIAFAMARLRGGAGFFGRIGALFQLLGALPKRLLGGG